MLKGVLLNIERKTNNDVILLCFLIVTTTQSHSKSELVCLRQRQISIDAYKL